MAAAQTIPERRASATAELAEQERAQGAAMLDGEAFDASRLAKCRAELEALDAAETEAVRRSRAEAAAAEAARRSATRKALAGSLDGYLAAVFRAEKAAREMVEQIKLADTLAVAMHRDCRALDRKTPVSIDPYEVKSKHSIALATLLRGLGGMNQYGCLKWNSSPPITDWIGHARKFVATAIQPFAEGK